MPPGGFRPASGGAHAAEETGGNVTGGTITAGEGRAEDLARELAAAQQRYQALLTAIPQGVIHYRADGSVIEANEAAGAILGLDPAGLTRWPDAVTGQAVAEDGSPLAPGELPMRVAVRTGRPVDGVVMGVPHGKTGETRWLRVTAVPAARDASGKTVRAYAILTDLTGERRLEAALRESTGLLGRLRDANVLGVVALTEERAYDANDAFLGLLGYQRRDLVAGRLSCQAITPPEWAGRDRAALAELRRTGAFEPYDKEFTHRDGHRVPVLVGGAVISQHPLRWVTFVVDLTARQRAEREQAVLLERERDARAEADYATERLSFLLRAGSLAAATRDRREMLEHAAGLVVPALADHCVVLLPTPGGALRVTSLAHRDPERAPALAEFGRHTIPAAGPMAIQAAYTTGTSQVTTGVNARLGGWRGLAPGMIEVLARLRAESVLATPLMIGDRPAGVLALARDAGRPAFSPADVAVMEEFARRLADALTTADTFAREHRIAETLQRSLLPGDISGIAGLDIAGSYLPATNGIHVGGDWYDVFPLPGGEVGLVIGDVAGHDLTSASMMGQVRSLLRAYALDRPQPGEVLRRTGDALAWLLPDTLASAVFATLDPATGDITWASAGHPPPLACTGGGGYRYLEHGQGIMLGAFPGARQQPAARRLPRGSGLLLYTDGLVEDRERDISEGMNALAAAMTAAAPRTAAQMCAAAESVLPANGARPDDVCLLAVRLPG